jgi:dTDP-glucose 4,6-dehydratase
VAGVGAETLAREPTAEELAEYHDQIEVFRTSAVTRVLLTGASGFVGAHVLRHLLMNTNWHVVCPVTFRHAGMPDRIASSLGLHCTRPDHTSCRSNPSWEGRVTLVHTDLTGQLNNVMLNQLGDADYIFNVASESHVDRSIESPGPFIRNNVDLMTTVLDYAREVKPKAFLHMSTDEVYGPALGTERHAEWSTVIPSNPYSASKAAQEALAISYWRTYGVPIVLTNTMNIIGELQHPEKFLPMVLQRILRGETLSIHADLRDAGHPRIGSRHWLHARNLADAWMWIVQNLPVPLYPETTKPARLHIVGDELSNLELAERVYDAVKRTPGHEDLPFRVELVDVHSTRPGHDLRYALDGSLIAELGWKAPVQLDASIDKTIEWTLQHTEWLM